MDGFFLAVIGMAVTVFVLFTVFILFLIRSQRKKKLKYGRDFYGRTQRNCKQQH